MAETEEADETQHPVAEGGVWGFIWKEAGLLTPVR